MAKAKRAREIIRTRMQPRAIPRARTHERCGESPQARRANSGHAELGPLCPHARGSRRLPPPLRDDGGHKRRHRARLRHRRNHGAPARQARGLDPSGQAAGRPVAGAAPAAAGGGAGGGAKPLRKSAARRKPGFFTSPCGYFRLTLHRENKLQFDGTFSDR